MEEIMKKKKLFQMLLVLVVCALVGCIGVTNRKTEAKNTSATCHTVKYKSIKEAKKAFKKNYGVVCTVKYYEMYLNTKYGKKKSTLCLARGSAGYFAFYFNHKNKIFELTFPGVVHIYGMSKDRKYILASLSASENSIWKFNKGIWKIIESNYKDSTGAWVKSMKKKYSIRDIETFKISKTKASASKATKWKVYSTDLYYIKKYSLKKGKLTLTSSKMYYYYYKNKKYLGKIRSYRKKTISFKLSPKCKYQDEDPAHCKSTSRKKICEILDWAVKPVNKTNSLKEDSPPGLAVFTKKGVAYRIVFQHA